MNQATERRSDSHILVRCVRKPRMAEGIRDYFKTHRWRRLFFLDSTGVPPEEILGRRAGEISVSQVLHKHGPAVDEGCPLVSMGHWRDTVPWVTHDYIDRGRLAAEYFLDLRLTHLAYIGHSDTAMSRLLWEGYSRIAREHEIPVHEFPHSYFDATVPGSPEHEPLKQWLADLPKPVGLLCLFSPSALVLSEFIQRLGWQIPNDFAILGGNPGGLPAAMNSPSLSYVEDNDWQMGYEAARLLEMQLQGRSLVGVGVQVPSVRIHGAASTNILAVEDVRLERAVRFLRDHAFEKITVDDVARHARLSRRSLEQMCKQELGVGVHEELTRIRINRAKELLASGDQALSEIALECGLEWATSLGNLFRKRVGMAPGQYRKMVRRKIRTHVDSSE